MVIVDALSVKNTVEGLSVCDIFKTDVSADSVMIFELKKVVVINPDVTKVEPGSVVVSIWVSLIVNVKVSGGLEVVKVKSRLEVSVTVWYAAVKSEVVIVFSISVVVVAVAARMPVSSQWQRKRETERMPRTRAHEQLVKSRCIALDGMPSLE
jgi:hypothetical protein